MISRHHQPRNTVEAMYCCNKCGKPTMWSMSNGHKVGCIPCMTKRDAERGQRKRLAPEPVQERLF